MKRKWFGLLCLAAVVTAALTGCGGAAGRTLKVGVKDDVANFGLYDEESGQYSGMEIDLAQQLCEDLGYSNAEFHTVSAASRPEMLDNDEVDMVIATYSITDERRKKVDFSTPYYTDYAAVMVEVSSMIGDLEDLKGSSIGVMRNTSTALSLAEYMEQEGVIDAFERDGFSAATFDGGVRFAEYDSYAEISEALEYGDVDAFVADRSILSGYIGEDRVVLPDKFSEQEYGVCTKKDSALSAKVDEAVKKRLKDGTIEKLIDKWGN